MTAPEFATATEREALCGFLDLQRAALVRKVQGVGDADARAALRETLDGSRGY